MFGRKASSASITKYLETYQQNENLPPLQYGNAMMSRKLYKTLSSTFLKAIKKQDNKVAERLEQGNENDHIRHEEFVFSYLPDSLKVQIKGHINRGVSNAKTISELKKLFSEVEYAELLELISSEMKSQFIDSHNYICNMSMETAGKYQFLILLRHGEGYYTVGDMHYDIDYLSCVDVLGVMDFPYINNNEIRTTSLAVVSRSPCVVSVLTMVQLIDCVKRMNTSTTTKDNALTFLLARSVRIAKEEERRRQEAELAKQEELRKCLAEWKEFIKNGDILNVKRYINGGFNVNSAIGIARDTPIILAMYSRSLELVDYLISEGANLILQNDQGLTALHIACQIGWINGVKKLIACNVPMIPDRNGNLPTHIAAQQNNKELILLFVNYLNDRVLDVDWYAKNNSGDTVIDCCNEYELKKVIVPKGTAGYSIPR